MSEQEGEFTEEQLAAPATWRDLILVVEQIAMLSRTKFISDELAALRTRVAKLESEKVSYAGVFSPGKSYRRGQLCTHGGAIWHCNVVTKSTPGDGTQHWTLAVKRGADGKDAVARGGAR